MGDQPQSDNYLDIIYLPHHVSTMRPHMPMRNRAAQFAPFAALRGFREAILETSRVTEKRVELDEQWAAVQNMKLQKLVENCKAGLPTEVCITYFVPDSKKEGGQYKKVRGQFKRLELSERVLVLSGEANHLDSIRIPLSDLYEIEGVNG